MKIILVMFLLVSCSMLSTKTKVLKNSDGDVSISISKFYKEIKVVTSSKEYNSASLLANELWVDCDLIKDGENLGCTFKLNAEQFNDFMLNKSDVQLEFFDGEKTTKTYFIHVERIEKE